MAPASFEKTKKNKTSFFESDSDIKKDAPGGA
jgi:hypothetical protein